MIGSKHRTTGSTSTTTSSLHTSSSSRHNNQNNTSVARPPRTTTTTTSTTREPVHPVSLTDQSNNKDQVDDDHHHKNSISVRHKKDDAALDRTTTTSTTNSSNKTRHTASVPRRTTTDSNHEEQRRSSGGGSKGSSVHRSATAIRDRSSHQQHGGNIRDGRTTSSVPRVRSQDDQLDGRVPSSTHHHHHHHHRNRSTDGPTIVSSTTRRAVSVQPCRRDQSTQRSVVADGKKDRERENDKLPSRRSQSTTRERDYRDESLKPKRSSRRPDTVESSQTVRKERSIKEQSQHSSGSKKSMRTARTAETTTTSDERHRRRPTTSTNDGENHRTSGSKDRPVERPGRPSRKSESVQPPDRDAERPRKSIRPTTNASEKQATAPPHSPEKRRRHPSVSQPIHPDERTTTTSRGEHNVRRSQQHSRDDKRTTPVIMDQPHRNDTTLQRVRQSSLPQQSSSSKSPHNMDEDDNHHDTTQPATKRVGSQMRSTTSSKTRRNTSIRNDNHKKEHNHKKERSGKTLRKPSLQHVNNDATPPSPDHLVTVNQPHDVSGHSHDDVVGGHISTSGNSSRSSSPSSGASTVIQFDPENGIVHVEQKESTDAFVDDHDEDCVSMASIGICDPIIGDSHRVMNRLEDSWRAPILSFLDSDGEEIADQPTRAGSSPSKLLGVLRCPSGGESVHTKSSESNSSLGRIQFYAPPPRAPSNTSLSTLQMMIDTPECNVIDAVQENKLGSNENSRKVQVKKKVPNGPPKDDAVTGGDDEIISQLPKSKSVRRGIKKIPSSGQQQALFEAAVLQLQQRAASSGLQPPSDDEEDSDSDNENEMDQLRQNLQRTSLNVTDLTVTNKVTSYGSELEASPKKGKGGIGIGKYFFGGGNHSRKRRNDKASGVKQNQEDEASDSDYSCSSATSNLSRRSVFGGRASRRHSLLGNGEVENEVVPFSW
jgi:hypothetical protein